MISNRPKKQFGQHFLRDTAVIQRLVGAIAPQPRDWLVEIGPGQGALTFALLPHVDQLVALEIDRDLIGPLQARAAPYGQLQLHQIDALAWDVAAFVANAPPADRPPHLRLVGNLPYNISTPLLFHLLDHLALIRDLHFMLQKEVVDRLAAVPHHKSYGRLSVMVQWRCRVDALFGVPPTAFDPPPQVDSAVVRLTPHPTPPFVVYDPAQFAQLVARAFGQRRKTLRNALRDFAAPEAFDRAQIDPTARAETLSPAQFAALSNAIFSLQETP